MNGNVYLVYWQLQKKITSLNKEWSDHLSTSWGSTSLCLLSPVSREVEQGVI